MKATANACEQLRALVLNDASLQEELFRPEDEASFIALTIARGREHGLHLGAEDVATAMRASGAPAEARLPPNGWLPFRTHWRQHELHVEWLYLGGRRLREPSFDESIGRVVSRPFNRLFRHATPIGLLVRSLLEPAQPPPAGLIFHMSRCGSTLAAQMLAAVPRHVVVSEASPIDAVVQARHINPDLTEEQHAAWLAAMIGAFGRIRSGEEQPLFVKLDSWHTLALPLFRRAFPTVPWIFLYRDPVEVLVSQLKRRGIHTLPGLIGPDLFGIEPSGAVERPEDYCAQVLAQICAAALQHHDEGRSLLVSYRQLPVALWSAVLPHFGVICSDLDRAAMAAAASRDAKDPALPFSPDSAAKQEAATDAVRAAATEQLGALYHRLEALNRTEPLLREMPPAS